MSASKWVWAVVPMLLVAAGCQSIKDMIDEHRGEAPNKTPDGTKASDHAKAGDPVVADARDAAGAVALLRELCTRAEAGDHEWVGARVQLPLIGIQAINDEPDPMVSPHDNDEVENFQYARFCLLMPEGNAELRDFGVEGKASVGVLDLGKTPHRVRFDLSEPTPKLVELHALIEPTPRPARPAKTREYSLQPLPPGFRKGETKAAGKLRKDVIAALEAQPNCIEAYIGTDVAVARFSVSVVEGDDGSLSPQVDPFQLVRRSLVACLRGELADLDVNGYEKGTSTQVELIIPVSAGEVPRGTPTLGAPR